MDVLLHPTKDQQEDVLLQDIAVNTISESQHLVFAKLVNFLSIDSELKIIIVYYTSPYTYNHKITGKTQNTQKLLKTVYK